MLGYQIYLGRLGSVCSLKANNFQTFIIKKMAMEKLKAHKLNFYFLERGHVKVYKYVTCPFSNAEKEN